MNKKIVLFLVLLLLSSMLLINYSYLQEKENERTTIKALINGNKYLERADDFKLYYIEGLMDMLLNQTWFYDPELYSRIVETAKDMTAGQTNAIFDRYLEEHPEKWHLGAASLFWTAMMEIVNENTK
jgi:hypothetical protein